MGGTKCPSSWDAFVNKNSDDPVFKAPKLKEIEVDLGKLIVDVAVEAGMEIYHVQWLQ